MQSKKRLIKQNILRLTCQEILAHQSTIQDILHQVFERTGDEWADKQIDVANGVLEYIREANEELRSSSYYWYKEFKKVA